MSSTKHYLNQAGNHIQGHFQNHGVQLNGNNISVGGNFVINTHLNEKNVEKECRKALLNGIKDPIDDRAKILSLKPRLITATCDWIIANERYKTWRNIRTRSQLLWVSGGQAMGKTMLAIFLTQEFDRLAKHAGEITVLYYFIDRQDGRDTAVHVMRGLIWRLISVRKNLINHLLEEYETQPDSIFTPNSIETLWRVFENMVRDSTAGQVYCVIDGLDSCTEDSLRRLVGRIRDFFLDEPQTVIDEAGPQDSYRQARTPRRPPTKEGAGLKMMLVSREEPEWLTEELKDFPHVQLRGGSKKSAKAPASGAKQGKQPPKLADVAKNIMRKQTLQKTTNNAAGPSTSTSSQVSQQSQSQFANITTSNPAPTTVNGMDTLQSPSGGHVAYSSGGMVLSSHPPVSSSTHTSTPVSNGAVVMAHNVPSISEQLSTSHQYTLPDTTQTTAESPHGTHQLVLPASSGPAQTTSLNQPLTVQDMPSISQAATTPVSASQSAVSSAVQPTTPAQIASASQLALPRSAVTITDESPIQSVSEVKIASPQQHVPGSAVVTPDTQQTADAPPSYHQANIDSLVSPVTGASVVPEKVSNAGPAELATELPTHTGTLGGHSVGAAPTPGRVLEEVTYTAEPTDFGDEKSAQTTASVTNEGSWEPEGADVQGDEEDDEDYNPGLLLYIEARIEELAKERQYTTEVQSFICAALEYRGDGTFLWVDFAVEELKKVHVDAIEEAANSLPPALDEMYARILLTIDPSLVDLVIGLLRWTVCARRPMDLLELTVALNLSRFGNQQAMAFILNAVTACGNMITIGEEDLTVNLVHQSLVDFLTAEDSQILSDPRLARFHIRRSQIDGDIATFCISYLESGPFNEKAICQAQNAEEYNQHIIQHPFVPYAASFWPDHLREASNPLLNLSSPFFQSKSKSRKNWWKTYWAFTTGKGTWVAPTKFNLLHLAAYLNLVPLAQRIAQQGGLQERINKRDSHGTTPLEYAVAMGHIPMFMLLLQYGAKQEPLMGETILELAVRKGQRDMVELLLNMGWDVNMRAQQLTPMGSLYTMARWLPGALSEGLELSRDSWHMMFKDTGVQETPLHQAATYGHLAVLELLLDRGADISSGTTKGFTPLHSASYTGQLQCVEILIERGANIYWMTTEQWLPLHYAAMRGKTAVVELFLDQGVPVDTLNIKSKTALHLAAYAGKAETVQTLVERGANTELKSYKGETPLHLATRHLKPQIVELLLSLGADRFAVNNDGATPIQVAQSSALLDAKECLRILTTYGMAGYVPWQPPQQPLAAQTTGQVDSSAQETQTAESEHVTATAGENETGDTGTRRASMAPTARTFGHTAVPRSSTIQGFEASISVQVHPPGQSDTQHQPVQPVQPTPTGPGAGGFGPGQPGFANAYTQSAASGSKFSYDSRANMQQYAGQDAGLTYGPMSPPSGPPPPYAAAVGGSPPPVFPEKSPAWTAQTNQDVPQQNPTTQPPTPAPASPPTQSASAPPVQVTPPTQNMATGTRSVPPPTGASSMVQMLSSIAISTTRSPSPARQPSQNPSPNPTMQAPVTPIIQSQQPYNSQTSPPMQVPTTLNTQTSAPVPLLSPFQPVATLASPYQAPQTPVQQFSPQQQAQFQNPVPSMQPMQLMQPQPPPSPIHYTTGLNMASTPSPYNSPLVQQQHPAQFLTPNPAGYTQPQQGPMPVQPQHFTGNSTASTYNSGFNYGSPGVGTPGYNPNTAQMPVQMGGGWQGQPNNGMMFAPPPPQVQKKKSFLGGLVNR